MKLGYSDALDLRLASTLDLLRKKNLRGIIIANLKNIYWFTGNLYNFPIFIDHNGIKELNHKHILSSLSLKQPVGIDSGVRVEHLINWKVSIDSIEVIESDLEVIQAKKDQFEIALIKKASEISLNSWSALELNIFSYSERGFESALREELFINKADDLSFDISIGVDSDSGSVWSRSTASELHKSEIVVVDFGVSFKGYCSDVSSCCKK